MSFQISPAFAQAELEYRQQRVRAGFAARRPGQPLLRIRLAALLTPRRRRHPGSSGPVPPRPMPAPHHLASS